MNTVCSALSDRHGADAQDLAEQPPLEPQVAGAAGAAGSTRRNTTQRHHQRGEAEGDDIGDAGAGDAQARHRPQAEHQRADSGTCSTAAATSASAGSSMLPVPRSTLESVFATQTTIAPANSDVGVGERGAQRLALPPSRR